MAAVAAGAVFAGADGGVGGAFVHHDTTRTVAVTRSRIEVDRTLKVMHYSKRVVQRKQSVVQCVPHSHQRLPPLQGTKLRHKIRFKTRARTHKQSHLPKAVNLRAHKMQRQGR